MANTKVIAVANQRDIVKSVRENFGKYLPVLQTVIPSTVRLAEISTADKSIFLHEPKGKAADAYRLWHTERRALRFYLCIAASGLYHCLRNLKNHYNSKTGTILYENQQ